MESLTVWRVSLVGAYLLGTIPSGLLFAKLFHKGDIRQTGSKSIGATNVLRTGSKAAAALTFACDTLKGALPVVIFQSLGGSDAKSVFVALASVLGHIFPFELRFKGGKGIATGFGALLALNPLTAMLAISVWGGVFAWKRISSLAALSVCFALPLIAGLRAFFDPSQTFVWTYSLIMAPLLLLTHRANVVRLLRHEEKGFR